MFTAVYGVDVFAVEALEAWSLHAGRGPRPRGRTAGCSGRDNRGASGPE